MAIEIRSARAGDEERVLGMFEWLFAPPGSRPAEWDPERARVALAGAIASPEAAVLVAEDERGELVGLCTAYLDLDSVRFGLRCWVEDLAVHPERRSQQIGSRLLDAAREWAREQGATHLELDSADTRTDAHRFYERQQPTTRSWAYGWELPRP